MLDTPDGERATRSLTSHSAPDPSAVTGSEAAAGRSAPARIRTALHSRTVARVAAADVAELAQRVRHATNARRIPIDEGPPQDSGVEP